MELIATVVGDSGQAFPGLVVTFSANQGVLSSSTATTNAIGEARTSLTTSQETTVTATAGLKPSDKLTITVRPGPIVSIECTLPAGTALNPGNCAGVQASVANNTATVLLTVKKATGTTGASSPLRAVTIDFGDGTSQALGNLASGTATVSHVYGGPSGSTARSYTATVQATDINDESASASTIVIVTPPAARPQLIVILEAKLGTAVALFGQPVTFTATVTPTVDGADVVSKYEWTFGDDSGTSTTNGNVTTHVYATNGTKTATVKVTTTDGRTATARVQFIIFGV